MTFFKFMARYLGISIIEMIVAVPLLKPEGTVETTLLTIVIALSSALISIGTEHDDD